GADGPGRLAADQAWPRGGAPAGRRPALRGPPLAREPERGLSDRSPARAGPDPSRSFELRASAPAPLLGLNHPGSNARAVLARVLDDRLAVARRDAAPDVPGGQDEPDGASPAKRADWCNGASLAASRG